MANSFVHHITLTFLKAKTAAPEIPASEYSQIDRDKYVQAVETHSSEIVSVVLNSTFDKHYENREMGIERCAALLDLDFPLSYEEIKTVIKRIRHLEKRDGSKRVRDMAGEYIQSILDVIIKMRIQESEESGEQDDGTNCIKMSDSTGVEISTHFSKKACMVCFLRKTELDEDESKKTRLQAKRAIDKMMDDLPQEFRKCYKDRRSLQDTVP